MKRRRRGLGSSTEEHKRSAGSIEQRAHNYLEKAIKDVGRGACTLALEAIIAGARSTGEAIAEHRGANSDARVGTLPGYPNRAQTMLDRAVLSYQVHCTRR